MHHFIKENHVPVVKAVLGVIETLCPSAEEAELTPLSLNISRTHARFVVEQLIVFELIQNRGEHWYLTSKGKDLLNKLAATA